MELNKLVWSMVLMALPGSNAFSAQTETTARTAGDFLNSIGICTHIGQGVDDATKSATALAYIGARNVRDDGHANHIKDWIALHKEFDIKTVLTWSGPDDAAIAKLLNMNRELAKAGALLALEGPNEPNNWGVTFQGKKSQGKTDFLPVAQWQSEFYKQAKSDPALKTYPVFHSSEAGGSEPNNVGLQYLVIPKDAGALMPDGTQFADYANVHNYVSRKPAIIDNMAWTNADPTFSGWTDGIYCEYGKTWNKGFPGYSNADLEKLPRVTTETGWVTGGKKGLIEEQQGRLYLAMYLSQFKRGFKHTFIYMLRDDAEGWGFVDKTYKMKTSGEYLHNLTSILADSGVLTKPGKLGYSISKQPATVHDLLLQKSDGRFALAVWSEKADGTADQVKVELGAAYPTVAVYDPSAGTEAAQTLNNVREVTLTLTGYQANIVEIGARDLHK